MVNLYWNIGRIITQDIQKNEKRADYGEQLIDGLATSLTQEYGQGYSDRNLRDMRRFFEFFNIWQALPAKSVDREICQTVSGKSEPHRISQTPSVESPFADIVQAVPAKCPNAIVVDFDKHYHLGWTHYRILLGVNDSRKREFYFKQAATQRWVTRELERRIAGALYERVALSYDTRKLVSIERRKGLIVVDHIRLVQLLS